MEDCEAEKAKVLANLSALVNATLEKSDLNGLSQEQIQGLTKNISANITSGLPECNMETFLTEVGGGTVEVYKERIDCTTVPFFSLGNWETGASEMRDRARDWSEQGRRPRGEWGRGKRKERIYFFVLPPHSPLGCASHSLQSLNYCGREKGTACSLRKEGPNISPVTCKVPSLGLPPPSIPPPPPLDTFEYKPFLGIHMTKRRPCSDISPPTWLALIRHLITTRDCWKE